MGILEKTRALLVAKLGKRIKASSADARALKDLILELEKARAEILRGLEALRRDVEWAHSQEESPQRDADIEKLDADIAEGEAELTRVNDGIAEAQAAFARATSGAS